MSVPAPGPCGPPTGPETSTSQSDLGSSMRRMLPLLAAMVLLAWLIASLVLGAVGVPLPGLVGLLPALALGARGHTFQKKRHEEVHAAAQLTFSTQGVELVDAHTRVSLAWADATRRTEVGTPPTIFDPAWRRGRFGVWIAPYRPDLLG